MRSCTHLMPDGVEVLLYVGYLVKCNWRTSVSLLTADAVASGDVATEVLGYDVAVEDDIAHHDGTAAPFGATIGWAVCHAA